jgi:hypothetical protein
LGHSEKPRIEKISFFMFKAMNFRESGEDKSDVLIANSIILGAFD